jgi:hypothetical protein
MDDKVKANIELYKEMLERTKQKNALNFSAFL